MINTVCCVLAVIFNIIIYFVFGSLITGSLKERRFSATLSVITGFFLYFVLFEAACIPVMVCLKPLHLLAYIWLSVMIAVTVISALMNRKKWLKCLLEGVDFIKQHAAFSIIMAVIVSLQAVIIINSYQFTLDAAYYVGTASTSLATDMINVYNPYTGMWQDHFEMRYFFANYAINDAVMCFLTGMHPLIWTKTVMEAVVVIMADLVLYRLGYALFKGRLKHTGLFIFFSAFLSFFYSTIYTAQEFFVTRTYEGKTVVGSVIMPLMVLVYIKLLEDHRDLFIWIMLFLVSMGAVVLSNSASMLFPAAVFVFTTPLLLIKRDAGIMLRSFLVMIPCLISVISYILYVKGYFVIYTIPGRN